MVLNSVFSHLAKLAVVEAVALVVFENVCEKTGEKTRMKSFLKSCVKRQRGKKSSVQRNASKARTTWSW